MRKVEGKKSLHTKIDIPKTTTSDFTTDSVLDWSEMERAGIGGSCLVADPEIHGSCHCSSVGTETKLPGVWGDGGGRVLMTRRAGDGVCTRGGPRRWLAAGVERGVVGKGRDAKTRDCERLAGRYLWGEGMSVVYLGQALTQGRPHTVDGGRRMGKREGAAWGDVKEERRREGGREPVSDGLDACTAAADWADEWAPTRTRGCACPPLRGDGEEEGNDEG